MKLQEFKIQIQQNNFAFWQRCWQLALTFFILALFSVGLVAQAQTSVTATAVTQETPTSSNIAVSATSPAISDITIGKKRNSPETPKTPLPIIENLVHNGDTLDVDVLGSLEYDWRGKSDDEGFLSALPYLDVSIFALCRTEDEIAAEIRKAYSKIVRNPQVVVRVLDRSARQTAILLGAVRTPQRFQIQRPVELNELLVMSGGITDKANGEVKIFRPANASCARHNQNQVESQLINIKVADLLAGKTSANPLVRAGDIVTVEEAAPVYLTGDVAAPQQILFRQGMTLSRAIASAGGLSRNANQTRITIYRRQKDSADLQIIEADFEKINRRQVDDVNLQAHDIIEISQTGRSHDRRPPVIQSSESTQVDISKLPVRLIN